MALFLGIDGGGTSTRALLCDERGRALGLGHGGVANHLHAGWDGATDSLRTAVHGAFAAAGLAPAPCAAVFLGMAATASEAARERWRTIALQLGLMPDASAAGVDHDIRIALAGGLSGRPGIALIAGTGSSCYGRTAAGATWQAGGWGSILDDGGGGYWLGLRAVGAAIRAQDGRGPETELRDRVLTRLGVSNLREIVAKLHDGSLARHEMARLAEEVMACATAGDEAARELLARGAAELAAMVRAVAQKLFPDAAPEVALAGSTATAAEFAPVIAAAVAREVPRARLVPAELPPVAGAALLALETGGVKTTPESVLTLGAAL
ncbi:MAG: BadF/BadG/BcrA/BcrD ATPase family protein [Opitutaceae bacterium]